MPMPALEAAGIGIREIFARSGEAGVFALQGSGFPTKATLSIEDLRVGDFCY